MMKRHVEWLSQTGARQWHRPPSKEELKALVAGHLEGGPRRLWYDAIAHVISGVGDQGSDPCALSA
jgi:hypothetical protein